LFSFNFEQEEDEEWKFLPSLLAAAVAAAVTFMLPFADRKETQKSMAKCYFRYRIFTVNMLSAWRKEGEGNLKKH